MQLLCTVRSSYVSYSQYIEHTLANDQEIESGQVTGPCTLTILARARPPIAHLQNNYYL